MVSRHRKRKAVIIGETNLCIQCTEFFINNKWKIAAVVSDDGIVIDWAKNNSVPTLSPIKLNDIEEDDFYLFSIINPYIIPNSFLTKKNLILALNYHDSLLPKYAGVNSTTWAIVNNEKQHGVTLHKISSGIDDGDIVAQSIIPIEKEETAISLNLKCSEHLLWLFQDVITQIESGKLKFTKQDLAARAYYGLKNIPSNYAVINGIKDIETIYSLVRSLTFGDGYDNPVATIKVYLRNNFYIAEDFNHDLLAKGKKLHQNTLLFNTVRDIYGNKTDLKISYKDLSKKYFLSSKDARFLSELKAQAGKQKKQLSKFFVDHTDFSLKAFGHAGDISSKHYTKKINFAESISKTTTLTLICFILVRFFRNDFIVSLYSDSKKIPAALRNLVENRNFIALHKGLLNNNFDKLKEYIAAIQSNSYTLIKDFGYRYGLNLLTDIAIVIGNNANIDNHQVIIKIKNNGIEIQGNPSCKLQIDGIASAILVLSTKKNRVKIGVTDLKYFNILNKDQYQQMVYDWNKTEHKYPHDKTIHQLFEERVARAPNNIAIVCEYKQLTYKELNEKANQLANYLLSNYRIKPDELIAFCLDRSEYMIIAMLGVLKAGGAYVPVDPDHPDERIGYILNNTKTLVVLTNKVYKNRLQKIIKFGTINTNIIAIDSEEIQKKLMKCKDLNVVTPVTSANLMYVIYTSGTTGNPKGVMIEHNGVVNYAIYLIRANRLNPQTRGSQYANFSFDATVIEIYPILLSGGSINIIKDSDKIDPIKISDFFIRNSITYAFLPTQFAELFLELRNTSLKSLIVGGDKLRKFIPQECQVINAYGPTEATVQTNYFIVKKQYENIPIGKPIQNVTNYILDENLNLLPVGMTGELYIGGVGVARGYINNPNLTVEKFILNPFQTEQEKKQGKNSKLYRTGDLVRVLPNGNLEYMGRNDFQVKIRGYRIELSEIEAHLANYPHVKQAVVLAADRIMQHANDKYLLAYYVTDKKLDEIKIRAYLATRLPEYMLPQVFIRLNELPLTVNGKLDTKALSQPKCIISYNYVAPKTKVQTQLIEIWSKVLGIPKQSIGIMDDFFNLGGSSITAIKLVGITNQQFKSNIQARDILNNRTVENLAKLISININQFVFESYVIKNSNTNDLYNSFELTNVQQAYYFGRFKDFMLGGTSAHLYIEYEFRFLDISKLEAALNKLIMRHHNLRMVFENGRQRYVEYPPYYQIKSYKLNNLFELENIRQRYSHKVYAADQLWLFDVFVSSFKNKYILHLSLDGLIMDAYSIWIFLGELSKLYQDPSYRLPKLNINYRDYIKQLALVRQSELFAKAKKYWLDRIYDYNFALTLPLQKPPEIIACPKFTRICKELDAKIWKKITVKAKHYGIGPTTVILCVYGHVLSYWSNQDKLCINLTLFNRLPLHEQVNNLIGDFTALELFNYVSDAPDVKHNLLTLFKNIHDRLWEDIENNLFDGLDVQRLIRDELSLSSDNRIIAPVVLTSIFGVDYGSNKILDESCHGMGYAITQTPQVWLDNKAYERGGKLVAEWDYVEELFNKKDMEAMHEHYLNLIEYLANANWEEDALPDLELPKLSEEVINQANIATQPNGEEVLFSRYESLIVNHGFKEEVAVVDCGNNKEYKYQDLFKDSNLIARYILAAVIANNFSSKNLIDNTKLIAILSSKGYNHVLGAVSVMKAGFGYLPLNADWPLNRVEEILDQAGSKILLISKEEYTNSKLGRDKLRDKYLLIVIEDVLELLSHDQVKCDDLLKIVLPQVKADNVAYVIFTSGSTGVPKGVAISHRGAMNTIDAVNNEFSITKQDKTLAISEFGFDLSVYDIFGILAIGGKVIFPIQSRTKEPKHWLELIEKYKITVWNTVPQLASLLIDELDNANEFDISSLRLFLLSGDWLPTSLPNRIKKYCSQVQVVSLGGATEGSIWSIWHKIDKVSPEWNSIPYGIAMPNQKMYVINYAYQHCPIGVIGEIYIGGIGVALNYWQDRLKTEASFINHSQLGKIYRTGDLGKWNINGYIEFMGRQDKQVKIRGYRVELGEVEKKLKEYPKITQVVVLAKEYVNRGKYLIAYYVASVKLDEEVIKNDLKSKLPDYMVPSILVHLTQLPLTANGKLNLEALDRLVDSQVINNNYVVPSNELERKICAIYAEVFGLPVDRVGIRDDFFEMGGDSITSIRLVSQINQQLKLKVTIQDIFNQRNIEQLVTNILINQKQKKEDIRKINQLNGNTNTNYEYLNKFCKDPKVENVYFANSLQQGFILHAIRRKKTDSAYVSQYIWQYSIPIDKSKFKKAWQLVQQKYPSLRLRFAWDKELIQIIDKKQKLDFRYIDLTNLHKNNSSDCQYQLTDIIKKDLQEYYDLSKGSLFRVYLVKFSVKEHFCIYSNHHIIIDGWSVSLLSNSVHEIYLQLLKYKQPKIDEDISYKESQEYLWEHKNEHKKYWDNYLKQIEDRTDLKPLLKPSALNIAIKDHKQVEQGQEQRIEITGSKFAGLKNLCQINAITINAVIQYVWHKILHIYGASNTTVVGTVVAGRNIPIDNIMNSVGLFINTLPIIFKHDDKLKVIEQIKVIQNLISETNNKSNIELASLQPGSERLFDSLISYQNYPPLECSIGTIYRDIRDDFSLDYPLALIAYERKQTLTVILKYAGELFEHETILQLLTRLVFFVEQIADNPYKENLSYLNQQEYQQFVLNYNKTEKPRIIDKTIHQIFEEQALKTPNNIALVCENQRLSYEELNKKANQLANYLLKNNDIKPDDTVVIILDRNEYAITSILAVLKTGAAYVPIDPSYPEARISYILENTKTKIVIKGKNIKYKARGTKVIEIDSDELRQVLLTENSFDPKVSMSSSNLIYVIYTSGTTGVPKGVAVEHHSVVNYVKYLISYHSLSNKSIGNQCAQLGFDASIIELYPMLLSGGTLHVMPDKVKFDPQAVNEFFHKNNINYAFLPTRLAELVFELKNNSLTDLVVIGEKLDKFIKQPYLVINGYGPTETTVQVTSFVVDKQYNNIPIGKPIAHVKCYVVDNNLIPLPPYVVGELVIGGEVLAREYLNLPALTAEKFVPNPLQTSEERLKSLNRRLYKTGDLARMLPDGNIEYIGRNDFQVKIGGYRIELGEVESALTTYTKILQAVVIVYGKSSNKHLVAYYVADSKIDEQKIKNHLLELLPSYMVPGVFIFMQSLPLTRNGKLDRKALPNPQDINKNIYIAPKDRREKILCEAFRKILNLKRVGVEDDFFSLGGNSIQAIKLVSILQNNFDIKIADIFVLRTPKTIAERRIFGKNFLQHKLEQIKLAFKTTQNDNNSHTVKSLQGNEDYLKSCKKLHYVDVFSQKPIQAVLLTGATGYLGCNILNQLLKLTNYKIYLLIRATSQPEAIERINKKHQFYFDKSLNDVINSRVFVLKADLEQDLLGLSQPEYQSLTTKIDSVIHAAALVKHYGEYDTFYSANVKSTVNLLEFAKLTKQKDFHYISTTGVLMYGYMMNGIRSICTEDDLPVTSEILNNIYTQTKLLGEHQVVRYQDFGLNCNIYRVGNLAFMSENYRTQENVNDNAFHNWLKCLFTIKCSSEKISKVEISQADLTAQAIIKIFDKRFLSNETYHIFNPYLLDMTDIFRNKGVEILPIETFIDIIEKHIKKGSHYDLIVKFLLRQGWLDWNEKQNVVFMSVLQNRTQHILKMLGFEWPQLVDEVVYSYLNILK